ncbi:MAG: hypothetical protein SOV68_00785, partial [Ligilactobacillus salivarius]|nr:hypothetical protein [Ligilactobacillus salivarius]
MQRQDLVNFKNYKVLFYFYQLVRLQAQPPFRMLHHASHSFRSIAARTGLQEKVSGRKRFIYGNILSFVHYLHLKFLMYETSKSWILSNGFVS